MLRRNRWLSESRSCKPHLFGGIRTESGNWRVGANRGQMQVLRPTACGSTSQKATPTAKTWPCTWPCSQNVTSCRQKESDSLQPKTVPVHPKSEPLQPESVWMANFRWSTLICERKLEMLRPVRQSLFGTCLSRCLPPHPCDRGSPRPRPRWTMAAELPRNCHRAGTPPMVF